MRFRFPGCVLDLERVELVRAGRPVEIEPQVFEVLAHLIRNRDRVVGADELFEAVWHGRIVSLSTLTSRISAARTAIGDTGSEQALIKTIPRRGYRFIGAVTVDSGAAHGAPVADAPAPGRPVLHGPATAFGSPGPGWAPGRRS